MYRFSFSVIVLSILSFASWAQGDSTAAEEKDGKINATQRQLRLGLNVSSPIVSAIVKNRSSYDISLDYCLKNDSYVILEGGFGGSNIDYPDLKYTTSNSFVRVGVDRSMLQRLFSSDWDMMFVGARYGIGFIKRSEANFTTIDNFWGTTTGTIPGKNLTAHWAELTLGMRVELLKQVFAGYNIRAKFLLNDRSFQELPPAFVAGYGKIEKSTSFDFNFYLCYAIRW